MEHTYVYKAVVTKVVDGDTIDFNVDLGFHVSTHIRTRLYGIDAPETRTDEGKMVRDWLRELLPIGTEILIQTYKDPKDKYGRWLAIIDAPATNELGATTLNELLIMKGFAKPYLV